MQKRAVADIQDPQLRSLVDARRKLLEPIRAGMLAMVETVRTEGCSRYCVVAHGHRAHAGSAWSPFTRNWLITPNLCLAWGADGHRIVGDVSGHSPARDAKTAGNELLGDQTLAYVSTLGDELRSECSYRQPRWCATWHIEPCLLLSVVRHRQARKETLRQPADDGPIPVVRFKVARRTRR